jgi:hypothetical protein
VDAATKLRGQAKDAALGAWLQSADGAKSKALREAGLDFLLFDPESTPAAALLDDDLGYVMVLPDNADEAYLRSIEPVSLEGAFVAGLKLPLTVAGQIELGQTAVIARKPILCLVPKDVSAEDLQCLRASGVAVVVTDDAGTVARLKESVAALPPRKVKREERTVVSLPRGQAPAEHDDDDDEP